MVVPAHKATHFYETWPFIDCTLDDVTFSLLAASEYYSNVLDTFALEFFNLN